MSADSGVVRSSSTGSRDRLLRAAEELFAERGYERTTVRDIGASAGVDPALIARYFGSKSALYLESLRGDGQVPGREPYDLSTRASIEEMVGRVLGRGPSPTFWAVVRPHEDPELQAAAMQVLEERLLTAVERSAGAAGLDHARLRAEIVLAALTGIVLSRASDAFPDLAHADPDEVARIVAQLLGSVIEA
jgi:AcrR family transcriptional regulator